MRSCVRSLAIADSDVAASDTSLSEAFEGDYQRRTKVGYQGSVKFHVLLRDLTTLEALLSGVVDAGADTIISVHAQTSRLVELRRQARQRAVRSARAKAEDLATAAGATLGAVLHIEDINPEVLTQRGHAPDLDLSEHDAEVAVSTAHDPGSITIAAAVMTCFAILQ